jgi:hypothetical protein
MNVKLEAQPCHELSKTGPLRTEDSNILITLGFIRRTTQFTTTFLIALELRMRSWDYTAMQPIKYMKDLIACMASSATTVRHEDTIIELPPDHRIDVQGPSHSIS